MMDRDLCLSSLHLGQQLFFSVEIEIISRSFLILVLQKLLFVWPFVATDDLKVSPLDKVQVYLVVKLSVKKYNFD